MPGTLAKGKKGSGGILFGEEKEQKMELRFVKMNPGGNITVLVTNPVERSLYGAVANRIMQPESVGGEQVGFIRRTGTGYRMEMMGGEFCGNASRCFAAWKLFLAPDSRGKGADSLPGVPQHTLVDVSGTETPLEASVAAVGEDTYDVSLDIPLPREERRVESAAFGTVTAAVFDGIVHFILPNREPREGDEEAARELLSRENLPDDAFGLMYFDRDAMFLRPFVAIKQSGSRVWESSCGSGSCSIALELASHSDRKEQSFRIRQPGGELTVTVERARGVAARILLGGLVRLETSGTVRIETEP